MNNLLSNKGLTSSEANHITNITKELVKELSGKPLSLFSSIVVKGNVDYPLDENVKNINWIEDIKRTGELYSLSAWLKSAIKFKENLLDKTSNEIFENKQKLEFVADAVIPNMSFEDYLNTLSIKNRNEYLSAESSASHIGKFVHNFDTLRELSDKFQPTAFQIMGQETVTIKNNRLYSKEELIEGFFELQKEHREAEKTVNLYKSRQKDWLKEMNDQYVKEQMEVNFKNSKLNLVYQEELQKNSLEFELNRKEKLKEISNLKVTIPIELQSTLDFVNQYAKK